MKFSSSIILFFAASVLASPLESDSSAALVTKDAIPVAEAAAITLEDREVDDLEEREADEDFLLEDREAEASEDAEAAELEARELERRNSSPVNTGALNLIKKLEGFRKNYYFINGHKTIGNDVFSSQLLYTNLEQDTDTIAQPTRIAVASRLPFPWLKPPHS